VEDEEGRTLGRDVDVDGVDGRKLGATEGLRKLGDELVLDGLRNVGVELPKLGVLELRKLGEDPEFPKVDGRGAVKDGVARLKPDPTLDPKLGRLSGRGAENAGRSVATGRSVKTGRGATATPPAPTKLGATATG
jgi:hypothetical protein